LKKRITDHRPHITSLLVDGFCFERFLHGIEVSYARAWMREVNEPGTPEYLADLGSTLALVCNFELILSDTQ
jgi:hypothetical protein